MPLINRHKSSGDARRSKKSGMALLVSLAVVTVLLGVTTELHRRIQAAAFNTAATRAKRQLDWAAKSGLTLGMAMLIEDKKQGSGDSNQEDWANQDTVNEMLAEFDFRGVGVSLKITDVLGKIQVNALVQPPNGQQFKEAQNQLWDRFLRPIVTLHEDMDLNATTDIINSMKDWMDSGDDEAITGLNGAESDYYQRLDPPYLARNSYMSDAAELLLVKGFTQELFFGSGEAPGIGEYITPHGASTNSGANTDYPGKVNIGTAPLGVLRALMPVGSEDLAESIYEYREERDDETFFNPLTGDAWYRNAIGCSDLELDPAIITNSSDYYELECTAEHQDVKKTVKVVVLRQKMAGKQDYECKVLAWHSL